MLLNEMMNKMLLQYNSTEMSCSEGDLQALCVMNLFSSQVLCVGNLYNPDVRYSFSIPIEEQREQFVWDPSGPWQECSRMCQGAASVWALCLVFCP